MFAGSSLRVCALSNEDIFLFKGVAGRLRDPDDMALVVQAGRGLDFDVIAGEFQEQLPLNTGTIEWELFTEAPENHPVIAFERALLSLPMTLPNTFTAMVGEEADRVYAEFELINEIDDTATISELTESLASRNTVAISGRVDIESVVESLVAKDLVVRKDDMVKIQEFGTTT